MKKCFIAAFVIVFLVAAIIAIPSAEYLYRAPAISAAKYRHYYFARKQWLADLRTMASCAQFIWSFSHPAKILTLLDESNLPPAPEALSATNPIAMSARSDESLSNTMAIGSRLASAGAAPPLFAILDAPPSHPRSYTGRATSYPNRYSYSYGSRRSLGSSNAAGTIRPGGTRTTPPQPPARPVAPGISGTNLEGV